MKPDPGPSTLLPSSSPLAVTPAPSISLKREASEEIDLSSSNKKGKGKAKDANGLTGLCNSINNLESTYRAADPSQRMASAMEIVEEEEGLSDNEYVSVVEMFRSDPSVADAYLFCKRASARTLYLRKMLDRQDE